jgi:hypothetical protein
MKNVIITGVVLLTLEATWGIAQESKKAPSEMHGMMQGMMKDSKSGEGSQADMESMHGMMGMMMKMMDQCSAMMKQTATPKSIRAKHEQVSRTGAECKNGE